MIFVKMNAKDSRALLINPAGIRYVEDCGKYRRICFGFDWYLDVLETSDAIDMLCDERYYEVAEEEIDEDEEEDAFTEYEELEEGIDVNSEAWAKAIETAEVRNNDSL